MAGLSKEHHIELNKADKSIAPERYDALREIYKGNNKALQQIDVYDPSSEYRKKHKEYCEALKGGNEERADELEAWFQEHYSDIDV